MMPILFLYVLWFAPIITFQIALEEAFEPAKMPKLSLIRGGRA